MKLFWIVNVLGDTSGFKDERCSVPGCSDSSCFIDVFFWSRVGINRRYWSNLCTAALYWGTAGTTGYGQGMVGAPRPQGLSQPRLGADYCAQQANQRRAGRAGGQGSLGKGMVTRQVPGCSGQSACGPGAGTDQWGMWPGAGMAITQLQHSSGRGEGQQHS